MNCHVQWHVSSAIQMLFTLLGIITGKNEKRFLETMKQFTSQVPPGANESNFITVSVLINTEQIRHQSAKTFVHLRDNFRSDTTVVMSPCVAGRDSRKLSNSWRRHTDTAAPRKPNPSLPALLPVWVALIGKARQAPLSSFHLIISGHHAVGKHKIWQSKPAAI